MSNDAKETAAAIFDRTAKLAGGLASTAPGAAGAALLVASGISAAVAGLIRALGIDGAKKAIDELTARRDEGRISPADVAADDAKISGAVSDLYGSEEKPKSKPKRKRSSSRRTTKKE